MLDQDGTVHNIQLKTPGDKIVITVDGIKYEIVKGSRVSSLEICCPGKEILTGQVDTYTLDVW